MVAINKDIVLAISLALSVVSLVLLFGVTWYFQSSLDLLQQQVEYDRELLLKLQEQISDKGNNNADNTHDVVKRQSQPTCHCKDGLPGPQGAPGSKGESGKSGPPGPKGDPGLRGSRGHIGDPGYPGPQGLKGEIGQKGDNGNLGDPGVRGPRGLTGDTGLRGPVGEVGLPGTKGAKGDQGSPGVNGEKGSSGLTGSTGCINPTETPEQEDTKGNGGTVYIRWGHDECPSTAQLVYSGRAGGSHYQHGGASNPQCLPLDPNFLTPISGSQTRALMHGAEYQTHTDSNSHVHGRSDLDVPCAVCHVSNRTAAYMVPAKYTCPTGWTREYYGYLMCEHYTYRPSQFTCVDTALKSVVGSSANHNGMLFYFVEGRCGSLPCPPYDQTKELSCAVCTK